MTDGIPPRRRRLNVTRLIFIGMGLGLIVGWFFPDVAVNLRPLSVIFIRLIRSLIAPLIFTTLVVGIAGHGDLKSVGRMGLKSLVYFEIISTLALVVGLVAVNLVRPGVGVHLQVVEGAAEITAKKLTIGEVIAHIFPQSIVQAAADGEVLQIVVFAVLFGIGLAYIPQVKRKIIVDFCDAVAETMFKLTGIVMKYAPIGVGAAIAVTVGHRGLSVLINLGLLILTLYGALIVFMIVVLLPVAWLARIPVRKFISTVKEPALIAFSTTSSEAVFPQGLSGNGGIRRAEAYRVVCPPYRVQFQS